MLERLQKIISRAGVASRRHAEHLIVAGQVTVNGQVVTQLGAKADPGQDRIKVAGKLLRFPETKTYLLLYKPAGCVATLSDPEGRETLRSYVHGVRGRVYPVGRLDYHAEGLLFLTNDGELANEILGSRGMSQKYWIKVKGTLREEEVRRLEGESGVRMRLLRNAPNPWFEVTLKEARRDVLRRSLSRMGHPTEKMKRIQLAGLELGSLQPGEYRHLEPEEVAALRRAIRAAGRSTGPRLRSRQAADRRRKTRKAG